MADLAGEANALEAAALNKLLEDQRRAYNIIDWHLKEFISARCPKTL